MGFKRKDVERVGGGWEIANQCNIAVKAFASPAQTSDVMAFQRHK